MDGDPASARVNFPSPLLLSRATVIRGTVRTSPTGVAAGGGSTKLRRKRGTLSGFWKRPGPRDGVGVRARSIASSPSSPSSLAVLSVPSGR